MQQAFLDHFSFQCGYCTPGFVNAATVLLERLAKSPVRSDEVEATIIEALNPHLCRCTGYVRYYQAVKQLVLSTPGLRSQAMTRVGWRRVLQWLLVILLAWWLVAFVVALVVQPRPGAAGAGQRTSSSRSAAIYSMPRTAPRATPRRAVRRSPAACRCIHRSAPSTAPTSPPIRITASAATRPTISFTR